MAVYGESASIALDLRHIVKYLDLGLSLNHRVLGYILCSWSVPDTEREHCPAWTHDKHFPSCGQGLFKSFFHKPPWDEMVEQNEVYFLGTPGLASWNQSTE